MYIYICIYVYTHIYCISSNKCRSVYFKLLMAGKVFLKGQHLFEDNICPTLFASQLEYSVCKHFSICIVADNHH